MHLSTSAVRDWKAQGFRTPLLPWLRARGLDTKVGRDRFSRTLRNVERLKSRHRPNAESLRMIVHGYKRAGLELCFLIQEATGGDVNAFELRNCVPGRRRRYKREL